MAVEKTLRLESTERFPLFHRHDYHENHEKSLSKSAEEQLRRDNSPNGVPENLRV